MKFGVILPSFGASQLAYRVIKQGNEYGGVSGFYEAFARPCMDVKFPIMNVIDAYGYDGPLVATTLSTAAKLVKFPSTHHKFFYVWDLEWIRAGRFDYPLAEKVYRHCKLHLLARSETHARLIENCWNVPVQNVIDDFDFNGIVETCSFLNSIYKKNT